MIVARFSLLSIAFVKGRLADFNVEEVEKKKKEMNEE